MTAAVRFTIGLLAFGAGVLVWIAIQGIGQAFGNAVERLVP